MNKKNFLINISILYRLTQKHLDKNLEKYNIGSGQLIFLFLINENEGITMQELTIMGVFDKGTTTKSVQKLIEAGYIDVVQDNDDKRVKKLFTTNLANELMNELYQIRNETHDILSKSLDSDDVDKTISVLANNCLVFNEESSSSNLIIGGLQKTTLLDYPDKVACTIFMGGCNFKCPFCHNKDLVFLPENYELYSKEEVMGYLQKRSGILDGVCISGGEPLLQEGVIDFIKEIKELGYLVKLDTNGNNPLRLKEILDLNLVDYVAMDIKNAQYKYASTAGLNADLFNINNIEESIKLLKNSKIDYEFRTTVVKQMHNLEDLIEIEKWISGSKHYLQQYVDGENVITKGFSAYSLDEMNEFMTELKKINPKVELRGSK